MTAAVKICGLSDALHVEAAVDAGAALTGFVFFPKSPRNVTIEEASRLTGEVPDNVAKVALTVDAGDSLLRAILSESGVDTLQLHGHESVERVADVKRVHQVPVIKALPIADETDVEAAKPYQDVADMLLFDAKPPKEATRPGGNAQTFDWTLLGRQDWQVPWLLAGGLTIENVVEAISITGAPMVDVSSGVEDALGKKSVQKIQAFIAAVNSA